MTKFKGFAPLLEYKDYNPYTIRAMAAASIDQVLPELRVWDRHGRWHHHLGISLVIKNTKRYRLLLSFCFTVTEVSYDTLATRSFNQFQKATRHRTHVKFEVDACAKAEIAMCSYMHGNAERFCYRVVIQGENNRTSIFRVHL